MKMLAVRNFFSTSHLYFFPSDLTKSVPFHLLFHFHYLIWYQWNLVGSNAEFHMNLIG